MNEEKMGADEKKISRKLQKKYDGLKMVVGQEVGKEELVQ